MSDTTRQVIAPAPRTERAASALRLSRTIALAVVGLAAVVVVGWILDVRILNGFVPGLSSMKLDTALGFVLAGYGLSRLARERPHRRQVVLGAACAVAVGAIASMTILEHMAGIDFGIDQALVRDAREDGNRGAPGRMALATALNFVLVGLALSCLASSRRTLRVAGQAAAVLAAVLSLAAMTAYLLHVTLPLPGYSHMALSTAAVFFALSIAIVFARPDGGLMEVLMDDHAGGTVARRLLPIVIVVPVLLAWLKLEGQRAGLYDADTGTLLYTGSVVVSLALLVWRSGRSFARTDEERRRAEQEVRASETAWRQLADAMPQIVWSATAEGWIDYFNRRWVEYADVSPDLPVAHQLVAAMHPGEVEVILDGWRDAVEHGLRYEGELRFRRASDGQYRWHLARALPVRDAGGEITKWYGTCTDIEDQKTATEVAERANRAKSEFLANMSHEIRTPMNGIVGFTELLLATPLTRVQRDSVLMIGESSDRLLAVINGILDFSKIESGGLVLESRPFSLRELVAEAARSVGVAADTKGLELSYRVAPDVPDHVVGDDGRLRQVLVNLMGNAVKFTERGQVVLEIETEWQQAGEVALHGVVRDTGIGIAPDRRAAIFEPFTQADGSTTRQFGGTGLGLTIAAQLLALMGGAIWVESEVGHGSAFHFRVRLGSPAPSILPTEVPEVTAIVTTLMPAAGTSTEPENAAPTTASAHPLRVLVAEDNKVNQRLVLALLDGLGHEVTLVGDGRAAVAAARTGDFDIALLDVHMPEMDGFEATAAIRAFEKETLRHLPIAAVTARAQKGDREACLAAGMDGYLAKPIRMAALVEVIERLAGVAQAAAAPVAVRSLADPSFDRDDVLARVEGDWGLLAELVDIFRAEHPRLLANLRHSVETGDVRGVQEAAHAIKGTVGNFGAHAASEAARALEVMGKEGALIGAGAAVVRLEREVELLERDLVRMGEGAPA